MAGQRVGIMKLVNCSLWGPSHNDQTQYSLVAATLDPQNKSAPVPKRDFYAKGLFCSWDWKRWADHVDRVGGWSTGEGVRTAQIWIRSKTWKEETDNLVDMEIDPTAGSCKNMSKRWATISLVKRSSLRQMRLSQQRLNDSHPQSRDHGCRQKQDRLPKRRVRKTYDDGQSPEKWLVAYESLFKLRN